MLSNKRSIILFSIPSFLFYTVFIIVSTFSTIKYSFTDFSGIGKANFVGMENYKKIFTDVRSLTALKNTLWYTICCSLGNTAIGLILAVLVDNILPKKITVFFRSVYFFPSLVALTFVAIIWQAFFQTDAGVINYYLGQLGIAKIGWLNNLYLQR